MQNIFPLRGTVQHYDWGGHQYIPQLLGLPEDGRPHAELWMGSHPRGMSVVETATGPVPLGEFIAQDPAGVLGPSAAARFGHGLPFLFKVLDVHKMLSIQLHPTKSLAEEGFRREEAQGIPLDAPHRTYRDDNHKPELAVALTEFWLLKGLRPDRQAAQILAAQPELADLAPRIAEVGVAGLCTEVLRMAQPEADDRLGALHQRLLARPVQDPFQPTYWAAQALEDYREDGHYDRGVFVIFLLNLSRLLPGEGVFQDPLVPHAYLRGVSLEVMANSDNVVRGGLTPKHVDVDEMARLLPQGPQPIRVIRAVPQPSGLEVYPTPAPDFSMALLQLQPGRPFECHAGQGAAIFLVLEGVVAAEGHTFTRGQVFLVPNYATVYLRGPATLYRAGVGQEA